MMSKFLYRKIIALIIMSVLQPTSFETVTFMTANLPFNINRDWTDISSFPRQSSLPCRTRAMLLYAIRVHYLSRVLFLVSEKKSSSPYYINRRPVPYYWSGLVYVFTLCNVLVGETKQ